MAKEIFQSSENDKTIMYVDQVDHLLTDSHEGVFCSLTDFESLMCPLLLGFRALLGIFRLGPWSSLSLIALNALFRAQLQHDLLRTDFLITIQPFPYYVRYPPRECVQHLAMLLDCNKKGDFVVTLSLLLQNESTMRDRSWPFFSAML